MEREEGKGRDGERRTERWERKESGREGQEVQRRTEKIFLNFQP